jgi:hypothetical protein
MDIDGPGLFPIGVSPINTLPVVIRVEARVTGSSGFIYSNFFRVSFSITPVGDLSSRFGIILPLAEDIVDLRQPLAIQDGLNKDDLESRR